ncbi:hypothetical protein KM043_011598 [Ampulex compressa]|nr:hypothetical protein KM043_011598 [Ampulex compressa]
MTLKFTALQRPEEPRYQDYYDHPEEWRCTKLKVDLTFRPQTGKQLLGERCPVFGAHAFNGPLRSGRCDCDRFEGEKNLGNRPALRRESTADDKHLCSRTPRFESWPAYGQENEMQLYRRFCAAEGRCLPGAQEMSQVTDRQDVSSGKALSFLPAKSDVGERRKKRAASRKWSRLIERWISWKVESAPRDRIRGIQGGGGGAIALLSRGARPKADHIVTGGTNTRILYVLRLRAARSQEFQGPEIASTAERCARAMLEDDAERSIGSTGEPRLDLGSANDRQPVAVCAVVYVRLKIWDTERLVAPFGSNGPIKPLAA